MTNSKEEVLKLAAEFDKRFTSMNGVDVPERVSVPRDEWRALHTAIKQALASPAQPAHVPLTWQSMESAPKDGAEILLYSLGDVGVCYWRDDEVMTGWTWGAGKSFELPTHWMPIPGMKAAQPAPVQEPLGFISQKQIHRIKDPEDDSGVYIPMRKTSAGNFDLPVYTTPPAAQPAPVQETKKSIVEALEAVAAYFYDGPVRNTSVVAACEKALNELAGKEIYKSWTPKDQAKLEDIEQYRMQMAGISTAAIGYWKEGDSIHPDYDTTALRDVAKLYARYAALYTTPPTKPAVPDAIHHTDLSENMEHIRGWNECRELTIQMQITSPTKQGGAA